MMHWFDFIGGIVCGVLLTLVFNDVRRTVKEAITKKEISGWLAITLYTLQKVWLLVNMWTFGFSPIKPFQHHGEATPATFIATFVMSLVSVFFGGYLIDKALRYVMRGNLPTSKGRAV